VAAVADTEYSVLGIVVQDRLNAEPEKKEPATLLSEIEAKKDPRFQTEEGRLDKVKYREYLAQHGQLIKEADPEVDASWIERRIASFLHHRVVEAEIFYELHLSPDNIPWNRIAHWRMSIWQSYSAGKAKGMAAKYPK